MNNAIQENERECPKCFELIHSTLGITERLLLNVIDSLFAKDSSVKVNGYRFERGKLSPIYEDLTSELIPLVLYCSTCGYVERLTSI